MALEAEKPNALLPFLGMALWWWVVGGRAPVVVGGRALQRKEHIAARTLSRCSHDSPGPAGPTPEDMPQPSKDMPPGGQLLPSDLWGSPKLTSVH